MADRHSDILFDIRATLGAARDAASELLFSNVAIIDDPQSFLRIDNVSSIPRGVTAGIVAGTVERQNGLADFESAIYRAPFEVLIRFVQDRLKGADEAQAMLRIGGIVEATRSALMIDPSRNGNASLIMINGSILNGTDVSGSARTLANAPDQAFYVASVPVVCGYFLPA